MRREGEERLGRAGEGGAGAGRFGRHSAPQPSTRGRRGGTLPCSARPGPGHVSRPRAHLRTTNCAAPGLAPGASSPIDQESRENQRWLGWIALGGRVTVLSMVGESEEDGRSRPRLPTLTAARRSNSYPTRRHLTPARPPVQRCPIHHPELVCTHPKHLTAIPNPHLPGPAPHPNPQAGDHFIPSLTPPTARGAPHRFDPTRGGWRGAGVWGPQQSTRRMRIERPCLTGWGQMRERNWHGGGEVQEALSQSEVAPDWWRRLRVERAGD